MGAFQSNCLSSACVPRSEESTRDNYAADLQRSLREELSSPESTRQFFQSTYPTGGMRDICRGIFRRLKHGAASNEASVYRLGSGFGGGKTHTLIALAGAALSPELIRSGETTVPAEYAPSRPVRLATFTGENTDIVRGALIPGSEDVRAKSLIGQIAWQLGGWTAFDEFREYDESLSSPGSEDIRRLLEGEPCLILVDELVQWLDRIADSKLASSLRNTRTLFSSLVQAVESSPNSVLVITTPSPGRDAYRESTQRVIDMLDEVDSVFARISHQTIPSDLPDLPAILRRRLFSQVDEGARSKVSAAYASLCQRSSALIAPPPQDRTAQQWFYDSYPLHPDTLRVIVDRIAGNDKFQNTRGILRLLGMTVHLMWSSGRSEDNLLIHPHHIDPSDVGIHAELTTRIDRGDLESAIAADITEPDSTAARIDATRPTRPTRRIARTALLASLAPIGSAQGFTPSELVRAVIEPNDDDPSVIANAIAEFRNNALYVSDDPGEASIRFTTVPNLNRLLLERRKTLTDAEIHQRIRRAIDECFAMPKQRSQHHMLAVVFPSGSDIPDNVDSVALGVINYEWFIQGSDVLPSALSGFYRNSPAGGGKSPRQYKNNFVVLVADRDHSGDMERHARRSLAAQYIKDQPPEALQPHQKENLRIELASAEKDLFVALQRLYVNLYYPSTDHPISEDTLMHHVRISPEVASERPGQGQHAVIHTLVSRRKLINLENADLNPDSYWRRRSNLAKGKVGLLALKEEFAREPANYMLLNGAVGDALLHKALDRRAIVVQTGSGQVITEGVELRVTRDADALVYLRENACPDCLQHHDDCLCGTDRPRPCHWCGKKQHPGRCDTTPPQPRLGAPPPPYSGGLEPEPLNVLAAGLRRHMEEHKLAVADIIRIELGGDTAEFINFMGTLLGQSYKADVSYRLRRGSELTLDVEGMDMAEWSGLLARVAPALERLKGKQVMGASVNISGDGNQPEQLDRLIGQFPSSHSAGIEVTFKAWPEERTDVS